MINHLIGFTCLTKLYASVHYNHHKWPCDVYDIFMPWLNTMGSLITSHDMAVLNNVNDIFFMKLTNSTNSVIINIL